MPTYFHSLPGERQLIPHRLPRVIAGLMALFMLGGLTLLLGNDLLVSRQHDLDVALREADNLTRALERDVIAAVEKSDIVLQQTADDYGEAAGGPVKRDQTESNRDLLRRIEMLPEAQPGSLRVIGPDGTVRFNAGTGPALPESTVAERNYFLLQKDDPLAGLVISEPTFSTDGNQWLIILSRRLTQADGGFGGLVQISLRAEYLQSIFETVNTGEGGSVSLYDTELHLIARHPASPDFLGKRLNLDEVQRALADGRQSGRYPVASRLDGRYREYSFRHLRNLPFIVVIGLSPDDFLYDWHRKASLYGVSLLALTAALAGLVLLLRGQTEQQRQLVNQVFANSLEGILVTDRNGRIVTANRAFCEISGYPLAELIGGSQSLFESGRHDRAFYQRMSQSLLTEGRWQGEVWNRRRNGDVTPNWQSISLLHDRRGRTTHYLSMFSDITELKEAEDQLRKTIEQLDRSNTELERFTYVAAHDLREPLRAITSFTQLLDKRFGHQGDQLADEYIEHVVVAAKRMHAMIGDLLSYAQASGKGSQLLPTNMTEICDLALQNLHQSIREAQAVIDVGPLPTLPADSVQMMQLLQNLLGNALKFRHPGRPLKIVLRAEWTGAEWLFSLTDNGIGIPSSGQDVFEIFRRLHSKAAYPGTGVGLAICKRIVERHQGRIWHQPAGEGGTTFCFTIGTDTAAAALFAADKGAAPRLLPAL